MIWGVVFEFAHLAVVGSLQTNTPGGGLPSLVPRRPRAVVIRMEKPELCQAREAAGKRLKNSQSTALRRLELNEFFQSTGRRETVDSAFDTAWSPGQRYDRVIGLRMIFYELQ